MNRAGNNNQDVVVIGHNGHQEVVGTIGQYTGSPDKVHVVNSIQGIEALNIDGENAFFATQTTLSVDETRHVVEALKKKYPKLSAQRLTIPVEQLRFDRTRCVT